MSDRPSNARDTFMLSGRSAQSSKSPVANASPSPPTPKAPPGRISNFPAVFVCGGITTSPMPSTASIPGNSRDPGMKDASTPSPAVVSEMPSIARDSFMCSGRSFQSSKPSGCIESRGASVPRPNSSVPSLSLRDISSWLGRNKDPAPKDRPATCR